MKRAKKPTKPTAEAEDERRKREAGIGPGDEMRALYDFSGGVRGKYAKRFPAVIVLDPDVAKVFPTSERVNRALRVLMELREAK